MVLSALLAQCDVMTMTAVLTTMLLLAYGQMVREGATFGQAGARRVRLTAADIGRTRTGATRPPVQSSTR